MATNIPPHNVGEIVDGLAFLLESPDLTPDERLEGLIERVSGPDFPTAGLILGQEGIRQAYRTGRGSVVMRARAEIELRKGDRESIVVTEIPYQVNKARLIEKIAELARQDRVRGIQDVRDESGRQGMRIVVDVKKGEPAQVVLNNLYKHTPLQDSFGIIFLAIVDLRPRVLNLLDACELFIDFRRVVVRRRTAYELRKAEARAHVLEGYVIALDHLDEVIALIRGSKTPEVARVGLVTRFELTEIQADEILKLQLQRLTGLERQKIIDELAELRLRIADLKDILASPQRIDGIITGELTELREAHGTPRRTEIRPAANEIALEDLIADEDVAVSITHSGYIKRTALTSYRAQKRGGRGRVGMKTRDEDFVSDLFIASTHSYILIFTDRGRLYWLKVHEIPEVSRQGKGKAVVNLVSLRPGEKIAAFLPVRDFGGGGNVLLATRQGIVKKTRLEAYSHPRPSGIIALSITDGDTLIGAALTTGEDELLIGTENGMAIHFREADVRPMGRTARGVKGLALAPGDRAVSLVVVRPGGTILSVTRHGYGKRTPVEEYRLQSRGGKGIINIKASTRNGPVVGVKFLRGEEQVMLITEKGMIIRLSTADISIIGRITQGVRLIQLEEGDRLVSVARLAERDDDEESPGGPPATGGESAATKEDS
jgi:DNA gyrase subunit A